MKRAVAITLLAVMLVSSCRGEADPADRGPEGAVVSSGGAHDPSAEPELSDADREHAEIYAAVITRLVTRDHTFGRRASPFDRVFVIDGPIKGAGDPMKDGLVPAPQPFGEELEAAVEAELIGLPPVEFIEDPDAVRKGPDGMDGVKNNGVIITLGPIVRDGDEVHVPNGLWCGGLCGQWLTYVVEQQNGEWRVTGTTGPSAIS